MFTKTEWIVNIGELVGEFIIGVAAGQVFTRIAPSCSKLGKVMLWTGAALGTWAVGRCFGRELFELSNEYLGTDIVMK